LTDAFSLRQRLSALRRHLRAVTLLRGVSYLLVAVLLALIGVGLLDWRWHLPELVRGVALVGTLSTGVLIGYHYLFRPLRTRADDLSLALRIEEKYPALDDCLASTVEFLDRSGRPEGESSVLEREAVRRSLGQASGFDFGQIIDARGLRLACVGAAIVVGAALTLLVQRPVQALTALVRLADPFGGHEWPKKTQMVLEPHRSQIGRNEVFRIRGRLSGVVPEQAAVTFLRKGFPAAERPCEVRLQADGTGLMALDAVGLETDFSFQVRANDAASRIFDVQVLPPPYLVSLDDKPTPQARLFYPAYTGLPSPEELSPGSANIEAVAGTRVVLRARADRPLARAWIEYRPAAVGADVSAFLGPLGAGDVLAATALHAAGREVWASVPAVLEGDRSIFSFDFVPRINGFFQIFYEDENGLGNDKLCELRLKPDPAPIVRLDRPAPTRDVLTVLPDAVMTLDAAADDPEYAVRSVYLEYQTGREEPRQRLDLFDPREAPARQVALWAGPAALAAPQVAVRPTHLEFKQSLPLRLIRHPDGSVLKEGDFVYLQVCADDYDDVSVNKEPGRSHVVEIRIVSRNALELELNKDQARVQQELLRLREKEREALGKVREAENRIKTGEKLQPEDLEKLIQAEQTQQEIRERVGDPREGLRAEVARILEAVRQNDMQNSAVRDRMEDVRRELGRLAEKELQQIEPQLTTARKTAEMQDEKAIVERRAALEQQAKQTEQQAKAAAEEAQGKAALAARAEKEAKEAPDPATKDAKTKEARALEKQAAEHAKSAKELQEQAQRDRQEAAQGPDKDQPRKALFQARKGQEEVEKTLNDLLTRMEPWSSSREIRGEASRLLEDQKNLKDEVNQMMEPDKGLIGKQPEELPQKQKETLDNAKEAQQRLEERARQLLGKMGRIAEERKDKDPETARELREALKAAQDPKGDNISEEMKSAREQIEKNNLSKAQEHQDKSISGLKKLVKNLEDRREQELDRLIKKMKKVEKDLADLMEEQERLQKKVKEAAAKTNPAEREAAMKQLAGQQEALRKKASELKQELARLRAGRASQALDNADQQMDDAGKQLTRGEQAEQKQEDILDRLDEALEEVEQARKQAEDQLAREQLIRVADLLKGLKERQDALTTDAERIQQQVLRHKGWTRGLKISLSQLHDNETGLATETDEVAQQQLKGAPVFARNVQRAAEAMQKAAERAESLVKKSPDLDKLPDAEEARHQAEAGRRLAQVLDAVKNAAEQAQRAGNQGGGGGGGDADGGGKAGSPGDNVPPVAQYKMLRDMQSDLNKRTDLFRKQHPNPDKFTDKDKAELEILQRDQKDVAELIDELNRPADEPARKEGDER
jgi:hypothetical protein